MKKIFALILFFLSHFSMAQNLVPNWSFEDTLACPQFIGQINYAIGWSSYRESPDYFNSCNTVGLGVPGNARGFQQAATGNAYADFACYRCCLNQREFMGIQLINPLMQGQKYFVSFKVSLCDFAPDNCAINKIGARFFMNAYSDLNPAPVDNFSHIHTDSIISDSVNWTLISGVFVADSNYSYLCVGNFYDDNHTDTLHCVQFADYYMDDVCVSTDSLTCNAATGVTEENSVTSIYISPNPFHNYLELIANDEKLYQYTFYSVNGIKLLDGIIRKRMKIDPSSLPDGVYILRVTNNRLNKIYKILKIN